MTQQAIARNFPNPNNPYGGHRYQNYLNNQTGTQKGNYIYHGGDVTNYDLVAAAQIQHGYVGYD